MILFRTNQFISGLKRGGLSGEHIQLCAEGARRYAESLRQMDGDACFMQAESVFGSSL